MKAQPRPKCPVPMTKAALVQTADAAAPKGEARAPLCFIVDEESTIRRFVSLIMQGTGVDTEEFADGRAMRAAIVDRTPDLVICNISLEAGDVIETINALGRKGYTGAVQLMSSRGAAVLENMKSIGEQNKLTMLPVLKKPFETSAIQKIVYDIKIGTPPSVAARITLEEALGNNWIEFWYQPKIDLRQKKLAGVEAFARARHPEFGPLTPQAFMPGASDASILKLAEQSVVSAIRAARNFSKLGVKLRMSVNMSIESLRALPIAELMSTHKPDPADWAGLVIDVTEEQVLADIDRVIDTAVTLDKHGIKLAIDDFGRGHSALARYKTLPFVEMKLDRGFVTDCGTDKVNAPICKTVIDLAHGFGSAAVAVGIEKASDAIALVTMGCDFGQGFLLGQPMPEERFVSLLKQRGGAMPAADIPQKKSA